MVQATGTPRRLWYTRDYSAEPRHTSGISHTPQLPWDLSKSYPSKGTMYNVRNIPWVNSDSLHSTCGVSHTPQFLWDLGS